MTAFKLVQRTAQLYDTDGNCVAKKLLPLVEDLPGVIVWQRRVFILPHVSEELRSMELLSANIAYVQTKVFVAPDEGQIQPT